MKSVSDVLVKVQMVLGWLAVIFAAVLAIKVIGALAGVAVLLKVATLDTAVVTVALAMASTAKL